MKKYSFTLIELLFVVLIISFIIPTIFLVYTKMQNLKKEIDMQQQLIQQSYEFVERLNVLLQDYVIDYEEYFNRQMVGCTTGGGTGTAFTWLTNGSGYCDRFTAYGNGNALVASYPTYPPVTTGQHLFYYCSSIDFTNAVAYSRPVVKRPCGTTESSPFCNSDYMLGCAFYEAVASHNVQSYGQYAKLFYDVKRDTDRDGSLVGDSDDEDLGIGPAAIMDASRVQELYLISQDGRSRLFFRRKLVKQEDIHEAGGTHYMTGENLYVLQVLRLRGFDAGTLHNFDQTCADCSAPGCSLPFSSCKNNPGLYDGQIDTWVCDASQGFIGLGASISNGGAYDRYRLPIDADDCWENLYPGMITLNAWNISLSPDTDPVLAWKGADYQINPHIKFFLLNGVYLPAYPVQFRTYQGNFQVPIQTSFNTKNFYY